MIRAVCGLPGSGKTYFVVRRLYGWRRTHPDTRIVSNVESLWFPFGQVPEYVDDITQCFDLQDCVLFLDEAHLWFGSRETKSHGAEYTAWVSQLRKRKVELWYTTQVLMRVDTVMRDITDITYHVSSWFKLGAFTFRSYDGPVKEESKTRRAATRGFYLFNPLIAASYDTHQTVAARGSL